MLQVPRVEREAKMGASRAAERFALAVPPLIAPTALRRAPRSLARTPTVKRFMAPDISTIASVIRRYHFTRASKARSARNLAIPTRRLT